MKPSDEFHGIPPIAPLDVQDREAMDENLRLRNEDLRWFLRMDSQHAEAAATLKNSEHEV